jgi:VIT1/CCC1 family predicted Fe2+/Mn2+ transporter
MEEEHHSPEHIFKEKGRIGRISQIRELVFGAQDGLLVPLGVVSTVAGAFNNNHIVIIAGISEALAGAFSMATGAYLASQAERQVHKSEIEKERQAIGRYPKGERQEMIMLFEKEGVEKKDSEKITDILEKYKNSFFVTMVQKELGIDPEPPDAPLRDALIVGVSYGISAVIPLSPYFFLTGKPAIAISILATFIALFIIGVLKGKVASLPYIKSGLQIVLVGVGSGIGGYLLGTLLPRIFIR